MHKFIIVTLSYLILSSNHANATVTGSDVDATIRLCSGGKNIEISGDMSAGVTNLAKLFSGEGAVSIGEVGSVLKNLVNTGDNSTYKIYVSCVKEMLDKFKEATLQTLEPRTGFTAIKNELYTTIDDQVEVLVTRVKEGNGRVPFAELTVRTPKRKPYRFTSAKKGTAFNFNHLGADYRLRVLDVNVFDDSVTMEIIEAMKN